MHKIWSLSELGKKKKKGTVFQMKVFQVYSVAAALTGDKSLAPKLSKKGPSFNSSLSDNGRQASSKDQIKYVVFPPKPVLLSGLKVELGLKTTRSGGQKKPQTWTAAGCYY